MKIATFLRWHAAGAVLAALLGTPAAWADATVATVGGGPLIANGPVAGYHDGDTKQRSQFNGPSGLAFDSTGNFLFLADRTNNAVRKLDLSGNLTTSFASNNLSRVSQPVDVVLDGADNVYVLNYANGTNGFVAKFNKYRNFLGTLVTPLTNAAALAIDGNTNLYIAELGGNIKRVSRTGIVTNFLHVNVAGLQIAGLTLTDAGHLMVSDAGNHALWFVNVISGTASLFTGNNGPGDTVGDTAFVQFFHPARLARAGGGRFVVADRGNHQVKLVEADGTVSLLFGVSSDLWWYPPMAYYPGWYDGPAGEFDGDAEAREPVAVAVSPGGDVYDTEYYYHLVRKLSGSSVTAPGTPPATPLFNAPLGLAVDASGGFVYVADSAHNAVERIELASSQTLTFATTNLNRPVALVLDVANNLFVLNQGNGSIVKFNRFANILTNLLCGFNQPTAMALDNATNLYVCELGGVIKRVDASGTVTVLATNTQPGVQLRGIAVMDDGMIAVSDSGNQALWLVNPAGGAITLLTGNNGPGAGFGTKPYVQLNNPQQLAKAGGDMLVVADQGNNRLLAVDRAGTATNVPTLNSPIFYGRVGDPVQAGGSAYVPMTAPLGVAVGPGGDVFDSEPTTDVVRWVAGTGLNGPGRTAGGGSSAITLTAPAFSPNYGYYPMGEALTVFCANPVYYTTDGTEPTTNNLQVALNGNIGTIPWADSLRDLTSLRLKAISGTNASATVGGGMAPANEIGATRDAVAGVGATALIPIVMNLRTNDQVRTIIYNVEITPLNGAPPVSAGFTAIDMASNDFLPMVLPFPPGVVGQSTPTPYQIHNPANPAQMIAGGLMLSVVGTDQGFLVQRFATVAMLKVPIAPTAPEGSAYSVAVTYVSATSDGQQTVTPVTAMPSRTLIVSNISYTVGDSSPGTWFNAGDFGNGDLNSADVNNAFYASLGVRVPYTFTDVFNAMDTYPVDEAGYVGGDGQILFLDWQLILQRSLRLDTNNYRRHWSAGGVLVAENTTLKTKSALKAEAAPAPKPGSVWVRQATICAGTVGGAGPGAVCSIPVSVKVADGSSLAGLSFRAVLTPEGGTPPVNGLSFIPAAGMPSPTHMGNPAANELLCGWALVPVPAFQPALQGSNLLGYVRFTVPANAMSPQFYTLRFVRPDGAPNLTTAYNLDSIPGRAWVTTSPLLPVEVVSDEWRTNFFHSLTNAAGDPFADADGDGVPNWQEYQAGTNPTNRASRLEVTRAAWSKASNGLALTWLSAPGKLYNLERSDHVGGTNWLPVATGMLGDGTEQTCIDTNSTARTQFYRIRLQP